MRHTIIVEDANHCEARVPIQFQDFAERFLRGDFVNSDPEKGRFRDYLRVALVNMIRDYRRRQALQRTVDVNVFPEPVASVRDVDARLDADFINSWRDELLSRTWESLRMEKRRSGVPFHAVLESSMNNSTLTSAELARLVRLNTKSPITISEALFRKTLQLAREKFADLLVAEVASSLGVHTLEILEQELIDLGLLAYCKDATEFRWITSGQC